MKDEGLDLLAAWWENGIRYRRDYIEAPSYKCLECGRSEYSKREIYNGPRNLDSESGRNKLD